MKGNRTHSADTGSPRRRGGGRSLWRTVVAVLLPLALGVHEARSQDIHFTMLDLDPMLYNPAYTGFFDATARFGLVYRNQWASVSTPFQTLAATAEASLLRSGTGRSGLGAGLAVSADRAGSLGYGATEATLSLSAFVAADRYANHLVSLAVEAGGGQVGFDTDNLAMDDAGESFDRTRATYPTLGAGAAWFWQIAEGLYSKVGLSAHNLNEPDFSYTGGERSAIPRRYNAYVRADWRMRPNWSLMPVAGYQWQRQYAELVYGCDVRWYVNERVRDYLAFGAGVLVRHNDAATVALNVGWHAWTFALAYDANISTLSRASHTLGAFEAGVIYTIVKDDRRSSRASLPCPIF